MGCGVIGEFILSNQYFLELAFDVEEAMLGGPGISMGGSGEGVRELLIKEVLEALKKHVKSQLDAGWEIQISSYGSLAKWGAMTIRRPGWPKLRSSVNGPPTPVAVRLQNNTGNWNQVCIGFYAPRFEFPDPSRAKLTDALLPVMMPGAVPDDKWVAVESTSDPFRNWWDRRFLIDIGHALYRARTDKSLTQPREIKDLGDRLVGIAQAAAKAVPVEWSAQPTNA
jgi:hypothetical protein